MEEKRRQKLEEDQVCPPRRRPSTLSQSRRTELHVAFMNVGVFVSEGPARGGDAADVGQEPPSQTEAQSMVLGRFSAAQHSQCSSGYLYLYLPECTGVFPWFCTRRTVLLSDPPALIVTADPALPLHLFLPPTFCSWTSSLLHHCALPSWSRFCRVGFPLSTRPCWTGAHAECFQSLPQIRNDLPM